MPNKKSFSMQGLNYNDWTLTPMCVPSLCFVYLTSSHLMISPEPPPPFVFTDQIHVLEMAGKEAMCAMT